MATSLVLHEVDDVDHWLSSGRREEAFGPLGITVQTFRTRRGLPPSPRDRLAAPFVVEAKVSGGVHLRCGRWLLRKPPASPLNRF